MKQNQLSDRQKYILAKYVLDDSVSKKTTITVEGHTRQQGGKKVKIEGHERELDEDKDDLTWGDKAKYAGLAGAAGLLLLTRSKISAAGLVPGSGVTKLLSQGKSGATTAPNGTSFPSTNSIWHPNNITEVGEKLNQGQSVFGKERRLLDGAISVWQGNNKLVGKYLETGELPKPLSRHKSLANSFDYLTDAVAFAPKSSPSLYRGMGVSGDDLSNFTTEGNRITMGQHLFRIARKLRANLLLDITTNLVKEGNLY
jgi:hypothetical protein